MAKFLTTRGTTSEIENIINGARHRVVLMSPFIKIPESLFQNLRSSDSSGVKLTIVHGKKMLEPAVQDQLSRLSNLELSFLENLHGKCYFNEQSMVSTSLNLYDFSELNNRELGVLISRQEDADVFNNALREAMMIIELSVPSKSFITPGTEKETPAKQPVPEKVKTKSFWDRDISEIISGLFGNGKEAPHGFCIGCGNQIDYDEDKPYCQDCYFKWTRHKWQKATYCHDCGEETTTTMNKPLCRSCYSKTYAST